MTAQPEQSTEWRDALAPYSVRQIVAAFPGLPDTTAYSWKNSHRAPSEWQRPILLAHLQAFHSGSRPVPPTHDGPSPETGRIPEWFLNWVMDNDIPKTEEIRDPIYQWLLAKFEEQNEVFVEALPSYLEGWARKHLTKEALQFNPDG